MEGEFRRMREFSLFSGAGGGLLGTKLLGWQTVGYVEFNEYCQKVLKQRILDGIFDKAPIFGDIRTFISEGFAESYKGMVDVITAGFPCQPFSVAGKGLGVDDPRNMWPQTKDCISIIRPKYCLLENVPGLLAHGYIRRIFGDLAEMGYDCRWGVIGADDIGLYHRRKRLWVKCTHTMQGGLQKNEKKINREKRDVCLYRKRASCNIDRDLPIKWKDSERNHGNLRKGDGVPNWMDRIAAIGNGQVPLCAAVAWKILSRMV